MFLTLLDRLGDWNPQLFRELKGRLTRRNSMAIVSFISLVGQLLLIASLSQNQCISYADNECAEFLWKVQWQIAFLFLSWILPLLLIIGGVHSLILDMSKEERRGTLNFIRLSPQSSQNILLGKMLGVPALLYLGIAIAIPLHLGSGLASGVSLASILGFYTLVVAACGLCYTTALLLTLVGDSQSTEQSKAWGGSFLAFVFGSYYLSAIQGYSNWMGNLQWFVAPLGRQPLLAYSFATISVSVATYWMWQAANRRFRNPNAPLLSKAQSYWLVASFEVWLLGWLWPELRGNADGDRLFIELIFVSGVNAIAFLILMGALSPHRQTLQDWARYKEGKREKGEGRIKSLVVKDWIWGEKSPAIVAIAINLVISLIIWMPWVLLWPESNFKIPALGGLLLSANLTLLYALLAQVMMLIKAKKPGFWAANAVIAAIGLPPIILGMLAISPAQAPAVWLFAVFPWVAVQHTSAIAFFLAFLGQWSVMGLLSFQLKRQLQKAGESASKALLVGSH